MKDLEFIEATIVGISKFPNGTENTDVPFTLLAVKLRNGKISVAIADIDTDLKRHGEVLLSKMKKGYKAW